VEAEVVRLGGRVRAWWVSRPGPIEGGPLSAGQRDDPVPGPGEVRLRVSCCGICRTDLHLAEGDLPQRYPAVVPGHQVVGYVDALGPGAGRFALGDRVGVAWLRGTCGRCRFCRHSQENLCRTPVFTGWDADGGYAELCLVNERFAYRLPEGYDDAHAAALLCSGIIGYRALRLCHLPPAGRLGIYGFGASAHLTAQLALRQGATVHVRTRSEDAQRLSLELGVASASGASDPPPEPLDAAILFAPAGELVPAALRALERGGTLAVAGIHLSPIPGLDYAAELFNERVLRSVTANTRRDGDEFLALAGALDLRIVTTPYGFEEAQDALCDVAEDRVVGAAFLVVGDQ
jgi:alcohol dehydrogenase, propanol-preferring